MTLLEYYDLLEGWRVNRHKVENFLRRVEVEYRPNAYHNNTHGADVTQTAGIILESLRKSVHTISKQEIFCIIIAAAVHDLGHLGVNNDFLINTKHSRATTYNDKSVNENFHVCRAFEIARESSELDLFDGFTAAEQKQMRKMIIEMVLATDMAIHFDLLRNFTTQLQAQPDVNAWPDRSLLFSLAVHLADIANPSRPFPVARGWAERVVTEFVYQGDEEQRVGLPITPMCDRKLINLPSAQLGFINIFLKPTLKAYQTAAPDFVCMALEQLDITIATWTALQATDLALPESARAPAH
ncbi:MAG: hypothetical protein WDW36_003491 [Sanguina aurantia]